MFLQRSFGLSSLSCLHPIVLFVPLRERYLPQHFSLPPCFVPIEEMKDRTPFLPSPHFTASVSSRRVFGGFAKRPFGLLEIAKQTRKSKPHRNGVQKICTKTLALNFIPTPRSDNLMKVSFLQAPPDAFAKTPSHHPPTGYYPPNPTLLHSTPLPCHPSRLLLSSPPVSVSPTPPSLHGRARCGSGREGLGAASGGGAPGRPRPHAGSTTRARALGRPQHHAEVRIRPRGPQSGEQERCSLALPAGHGKHGERCVGESF
jgi:hypothetical protein